MSHEPPSTPSNQPPGWPSSAPPPPPSTPNQPAAPGSPWSLEPSADPAGPAADEAGSQPYVDSQSYAPGQPYLPRDPYASGPTYAPGGSGLPGLRTDPTEPVSQPQRAPSRTGRVVTAAVLLSALVGGAAGFGGAALFEETSTTSDSQTPLVRSSSDSSTGDSAADPVADTSGAIEAAAAQALPSVVKIYAAGADGNGSGSGIILTPDGQLLTNNHVVEVAADGGQLAVSFSDGTTAKATILGRDPLTDLAVIKTKDVSGLTPATLGDSDSLTVGDQVVAVGAPFGLESTVTSGIVSALNRPVTSGPESGSGAPTVFPAIQTDAAINPGNSGGPLIDLDGNVVGINSAIRTDSATGGAQGGSIGLGFAIPISDATAIVEQLRAGEKATHARIGVSVGIATDDVGLPGGALVESVDGSTAAADAGLEGGDVITAVDGMPIANSDSLVATVRSYRPGDVVTLTVTASQTDGNAPGETRQVEVELGSD